MRPTWLGLIVAFGLAGCEAEKPAPTSEPVKTVDAVAAQPEGLLPGSEPKKPEAESAKQGATNSSRIYQLKDLKTADLTTPKKTIKVWIMDDEGKRQEGMMFLTGKEVKDEQGMLFVFQKEAPQSFWMSNTLIPLDIVYIGANGTVRSIAKGRALDETSLPSEGPAQYVLELKQGMAAKLGIAKGGKLTLPKVKAAE